MSQHALSLAAAGQFWARYLLPTLGIAVAAVLLGARRVPLVLLAGCVALVAEGYAALVHTGGGVNDLLPAYLAVAVLAGLALGGRADAGPGRRAGRLAWARTVTGSLSKAGRHVPVAAGALVIAQLAVLAAGFRPGLPSRRARTAPRACG